MQQYRTPIVCSEQESWFRLDLLVFLRMDAFPTISSITAPVFFFVLFLLVSARLSQCSFSYSVSSCIV